MTTTRRSNFSAALRTTLLMAGLGGLLVVIGALIGGPKGAAGFLVLALLFNLGAYWFSDRIALEPPAPSRCRRRRTRASTRWCGT